MSGDDHVVYVLECADETFYTGYDRPRATRRRTRRRRGAKYARADAGRTQVPRALRLALAGDVPEYEIKQLSRGEKERLIGLE